MNNTKPPTVVKQIIYQNTKGLFDIEKMFMKEIEKCDRCGNYPNLIYNEFSSCYYWRCCGVVWINEGSKMDEHNNMVIEYRYL